jgi:hypothetical protein
MSDLPQPPNELQDRPSRDGQNLALQPLPEPGRTITEAPRLAGVELIL